MDALSDDYWEEVMEYITITEVADEKGVSRATVYKWIDLGKIDTRKCQGRIKVVANDKLDAIEAKNNLQHMLKIFESKLGSYESRIASLENLVQKQNDRILELESSLKSKSPKKVKPRTLKNNTKSKSNKDNKISNKRRSEIISLINKALDKGFLKKDLDPKTRGSGIGRILRNPQGTTDKKLAEVEENVRNLLNGK